VKPVLLVLDQNVEHAKFFDTVKEAQDEVAKQGVDNFAFVDIFTLYTSARFQIVWELATDTATNLREVKKAEVNKEGVRKGKWTEREIKTMTDAYEKGMQTGAIAKMLHRTPGSVYQKAVKLGVK